MVRTYFRNPKSVAGFLNSVNGPVSSFVLPFKLQFVLDETVSEFTVFVWMWNE